MKKVFVSQLLVDVESRKELLDQAGIPCMIKNQRSSGLGGEVPFAEVFPELWVLHEEDEVKAQEIFRDWEMATPTKNTEWTCNNCGESLEGKFTACWKCGQERDSKERTSSPPLETFTENKDQDNFKRYFPQGLIVGIILTWGTITGLEYLSKNENLQDRNRDGKDDYIETRVNGYVTQTQMDQDFDGTFETTCKLNAYGWHTKCATDRNHDGEPDLIHEYALGRYTSTILYDLETGKVRKRQYFKLGMKVREKIDEDGDGEFEKTIYLDQNEDPISASTN